MAQVKNLDWLAEQALDVLKAQGCNAAYLESKEHDLGGKDRLAVLRWCSNLDSNNLGALAVSLNVPIDDLRTTIKTVCAL